MNRRNDWQGLLKYANEDAEKKGYKIKITEKDGCYKCDIMKGKVLVQTYAENYYEDELSDLVTDVWHYVNTEIQ